VIEVGITGSGLPSFVRLSGTSLGRIAVVRGRGVAHAAGAWTRLTGSRLSCCGAGFRGEAGLLARWGLGGCCLGRDARRPTPSLLHLVAACAKH
jgi:hypothetical protein